MTSSKAAWGALWDVIAPGKKFPDLPEDQLEAFLAFLDAMGRKRSPRGFARVPAEPGALYAVLSVAETYEAMRVQWAARLSGMVGFQTPVLQDITLYVDTIHDEGGAHRVYMREEELLPGIPSETAFASIDDAVAWMTAVAREEDPEPLAGVLEDDWEAGPTSGLFILESLAELPLPEAWRALLEGQWPEALAEAELDILDRSRGWSRRVALYVAEQFLVTRELTLPKGLKVAELQPEHAELVEHLEALAEASSGKVPAAIHAITSGASGQLAARASAWIAAFENAQAAAAGLQNTFSTKLAVAVGRAIEAMAAEELIEVEEQNRTALIAEIVSAGADASSERNLLKRMVRALVRSDLVEEVYGSDLRLTDVLRMSLDASANRPS